ANEKLQCEVAERKRTEKSLRESEAMYSTLVEKGNDQIVISQDGIIKYANAKMLEVMGLTLKNDLGKPFIDFITPEYREIALSMYQKRMHGVETPNKYELELTAKGGKTISVEVNASVIEYEGKPASMAILRDITDRKRAEKELISSHKQLEGIIENIIDAMSRIVETRDPYTAGHQQRVAKLACAIAHEMGLPEDRIKGIRMAGIIHDIGKISVPGEILAKPGRLSKPEFDMIKAHAQMGYDILKAINFPWPIAQIVLQHHERIDSSGYPGGMAGENILLEAEILSVADVVEAMSSHRPYRPALGIDKALDEISGKRGLLYHPAAVDACVRLFREKKFSFE
ncbi:MAG: HD domain-containing phosphohydrolase, partial [Candidatus Omnitrophota bacterium]